MRERRTWEVVAVLLSAAVFVLEYTTGNSLETLLVLCLFLALVVTLRVRAR